MNDRVPQHPVVDLIINRWSPRAMSGEPITHEELMSLFEAARWAPSSYNHQPWRFIYAHRDTPEWTILFNLLVPANQLWVKKGAALIVALSHQYFEYNNAFSRTHSLDTGAATQNLALQGSSMGLVVHGMEGFDYDRAIKELAIPDGYTVEAMYVVGKHGNVADLPEKLQKSEQPNDRLPVDEIAFKGIFKGN